MRIELQGWIPLKCRMHSGKQVVDIFEVCNIC